MKNLILEEISKLIKLNGNHMFIPSIAEAIKLVLIENTNISFKIKQLSDFIR